MPIRDASKADIVSIYAVPHRNLGSPMWSSVHVAVRYSEDESFKAEYPDAKQVMVPPCVLYKVS